MRINIFLAVCTGVLGFVAPGAAAAQPISNGKDSRTISVSGEADVKVVPDQVVLTLGVESLGKKLPDAKRDNDEKMKRVFSIARASGLDDKQIQTDQISIEPRYENSSNPQTFLGYVVRKSVSLTLKDLSKFEGLLGGALDGGANYVHGVQFMTTKLRENRDRARAAAIKAAKEKAAALAKELGMKVGLPRSINESGGGWWSSYGGWGASRMSQNQNTMRSNVMHNAGGQAGEAGAATAPGTISVTAHVGVTFDLER